VDDVDIVGVSLNPHQPVPCIGLRITD